MEAAAKEKLEISKQQIEEAERARLVLNKFQTTYKNQVFGYASQAQTVVGVIERLKREKQEAEECATLGVDRIRHIMLAWRDLTWTSINDCSEKLWKEWSQQAAELQTLQANVENRRKAGDKFYKMDEESIIIIKEELSEAFFSLAKAHLGAVRGLVEKLDEDQLETRLQLEKYER